MDMIVLSLIVVSCAIVVFFSQEFGKFFKKLFAIRGMKLFLPLVLASAIVVDYSNWVLWGLLRFKAFLHSMVATLASWLFFHAGATFVANVLVLAGFSILPVLAINSWVKKKTYHSFHYAYLTSTIIWLLIAVLLTVSYNYSITN
jgi:hypothetical protein